MFPCGGLVGTAGMALHSLMYVGSEVPVVKDWRTSRTFGGSLCRC